MRIRAGVLAGAVLMLVLMNATAHGHDLRHAVIHDLPQAELVRQFGEVPRSQLTLADSIAISSFRFTGDTLKVLVFLIEWADRPGTYSREAIDSQMFSTNVYPTGSLNDYYNEVSYGTMAITGDVVEWYDGGTYTINYEFSDLFPALDALVDFSQYDGDHDGSVDAVFFIRSGNGKEDSQDHDDIWSYAFSFPPGEGPGPYDGMYIDHWLTVPETRPLRNPLNPTLFSGIDTLNRVGPCAHELGHCLGLPDLYDYDNKVDIETYDTPNDNNDHPLVDWCLMGYGGYGLLSIGSVNTRHFCGWSKMQLGWVEPIVLDNFIGEIVINNIETNSENSLYFLPIDSSEGEYFLLEYRNPPGDSKFDKTDSDFSVYLWPWLQYGYDPLERGLLITHVHDSLVLTGQINNGFPSYSHYSVVVEDVGYNPNRDGSTNPEGHVTDSAHWWYPYETRKGAPFTSVESGKELFGPNTYPNSDGYNSPTGIFVRVDSLVDERLYAYVKVPSNNWRVDIESKIVYSGTSDATVGITAYWDMEMSELVIPLVFREIDPGAFWTGALPVDTIGGISRGVAWNWANPGWADGIQEVRPGIPEAPCDGGGDSGYDGISPDHLVVAALAAGLNSTPAEPDGREVVTLTFDVGETHGTFEIDTACFAGQYSGLSMVDAQFGEDHGPAGPDGDNFLFVKGTITIYQSLNPEISSTSPARNAIDVAATTDIAVTFTDEIDGSTVNASTMMVDAGITGPHDATITYYEETQTAILEPLNNFTPGEVVTVTLTNQILTTGGTPFGADYSWSFTIGTTAGGGIFTCVADYQVPYTRACGQTIADVDKDGDPDLIIAVDPTVPPRVRKVSIWLNDGSGEFEYDSSYAIGDDPYWVTTADFDADGYLDIVTANYGSKDLSFLMNNGDGTFAPVIDHDIPFMPYCITAADFNGDGYPDIAVGSVVDELGEGRLLIKMNQKNGTFPVLEFLYQTLAVGLYPWKISSGDMDLDGDIDLVYTERATCNVAIALNQGTGSFAAPNTLHLGWGNIPGDAIPADLDGDGDLDILVIVGRYSNLDYLAVFLNDGRAEMTPAGMYMVNDGLQRPAIGDFDHDGDLDILISLSSTDSLACFINDGNGAFTIQTSPATGGPFWLTSADFDGNGSLDCALIRDYPEYTSVFLSCDCSDLCDLDQDGSINPVDVVIIVNLVYRQLDSRVQLSGCLAQNGDWNSDGQVNPVDVVWYVNYVYKLSGVGPADPCSCAMFPTNCPGP